MDLIKDINSIVRKNEQELADKANAEAKIVDELANKADKGKSVQDYINDIEAEK